MGMVSLLWSGRVPARMLKWLTSSRCAAGGRETSNIPWMDVPGCTGNGFCESVSDAPGNRSMEKITAAGFLPRLAMV